MNGEELAAANLSPIDWQEPGSLVYSRYNHETRDRAEKVLGKLMQGHAITYGSGMAAAYACLVYYSPSVVAIRRGYMTVHSALKLYSRGRTDLRIIDIDDEYPTLTKSSEDGRTGGLMVWIETPLNPTGEARDLEHYAQRAHAVGGFIGVDSTFAPPPLQNPFAQGVDIVMHSATKYLGGHSDLLVGAVAVPDAKQWETLFFDRITTGAVPGNLESFLLLRSLRTLPLRVQRQSQTAQQLADWLFSLSSSTSATPSTDPEDAELVGGKVVEWVWHASLQPRKDEDPRKRKLESPGFDPRKQMSGGFSPTFSIRAKTLQAAAQIPHATSYFVPATSLGGVESLLEHRIIADKTEDPCLVRISVGLEDFVDLQADLRQAFKSVLSLV